MFKREQITSFSEIRLKVSGMRLTEVYEILCCGDDAEVSQYWLSYKNHEDNYNLQKHVTVPAADVIDVLNQCGSTMFSFTATVNGGRRLNADGSNNFPKHYRDFTDVLYRMLNTDK